MSLQEKTKSFFSNYYVWFFIIMILTICIESSILKPIIKNHYLDQDLTSFKDYSWKYLIDITVFVAIVLAFFIKPKKIFQIIGLFIYSAVLVFLPFRKILISMILCINIQTEKSQISNTYEVISHKETKTFWLNADDKKSINDNDEMKLIDKRRKAKGQKSLFEYKMNDTIQLKLKKGIFNVNYIE